MAGLLAVVVGILAVIISASASSPPPDFNGRPRGVAKSKLSFYDSSKPFTCLDGSRTMPYAQVNDDFCDCPDGSDEPGTPACSASNGKFHCANKGHKPIYIPASRVNDGICDCCDGSDEYDGRVQCEDACRELGAQAREEAKRLAEVQQRGFQIREEYGQQGQVKLAERRTELSTLEASLKEAQAEADRLKALKEEAEAPETDAKDAHKKAWEAAKIERQREAAEAAFRDLDSNGDGLLSAAEVQARVEFDKDSSGDVSEDEAKEWLDGETERAMEYFVTELWKNIATVYVVPGSEDATPPPPPVESEEPADPEAAEPPTEPPTEPGEAEEIPSEHEQVQDISLEDPPHAQVYDIDNDDDDDDDDDYNDDDDFEDRYNEQQYNSHAPAHEEEGMPEYDEATQTLVAAADAARTAFTDADKKREDIQHQIDTLNKQLGVDLGPNNEFFPLQGQCYDFTDREYTYSLCAFDRISQKPKNGGSETSLGTWGKWNGPEGNKYSAMIYENGNNCWNGPNRSGAVKLQCGETNELVSAAEPNRCEYSFEFITPAACQPPSPRSTETHEHEEL